MEAPRKRSEKRHRTNPHRRVQLGQHFFTSRSIARRIVRSLNLQQSHSVLEIGAGEGFFTTLIAPVVRHLEAIELDTRLVAHLEDRFRHTRNVTVVRRDVSSVQDLDRYDIVFGNIPFNQTANVFRIVCHSRVGFSSCHLIVQEEAAYRLLGSGRPTEMAVLAYPLVKVDSGMRIPRWAFNPPPSVDSMLLHIRARPSPLIPMNLQREFRDFVKHLFRSDIRKLHRVIGRDISYRRWRRICSRVGIQPGDSHLALDMQKYVDLFYEIHR